MSALSALVQQLAYKRWANDELLTLGAASRSQLPADDYRMFVRIINHTYVVDRIFAAHLTGQEHGYTSTNTEATPEIADLHAAVSASDQWFVHHVQGLNESQLEQRLMFRFTDGDVGAMTRGEMLTHLVVHGTYHRGAAGRILAANGVQPPRDSLTVFLHRLEPQRRAC